MTRLLMRFDPFAGTTRWSGSLDRLLEDAACEGECAEPESVSPALDVREEATHLEITVELPGLERKDIDVAVKEGVLTIRGEKRRGSGAGAGTFHRVERRYGVFGRALSLPETVDPERIDARFRDGVLHVVLPKRAEAKPRVVEIQE